MSISRTYRPVMDRSAWRGSELQDADDWLISLDERNIRDFSSAIASVEARKLPIEAITRDAFPLPSLERLLSNVADELENGRGFVLFRGLPVIGWGDKRSTIAFWGLSTYLGAPVTQNLDGQRLVSVRDTGASAEDLNVRGPLTNSRLYYHSDFSDIVGLLCLRPAREGGISRICSSIEIFNRLIQSGRLDLIDALYDGYLFDRKGEQREGVSAISDKAVPMLSWYHQRLSFRFVPGWVEAAAKRTGNAWSPLKREAFDEVNRLSSQDGMYLDMQFKPGDTQFLNNYAVLHSRTAFLDYDEPDKKRLLQRIWLRAHTGRSLADDFDHLFGDDKSTRDGIPPRVSS